MMPKADLTLSCTAGDQHVTRRLRVRHERRHCFLWVRRSHGNGLHEDPLVRSHRMGKFQRYEVIVIVHYKVHLLQK